MAVAALLFITASLCGVIWLILYHIKRLDLYREVAKFPGPPLLPIIGNAHHFMGNTADVLNTLIMLWETYPSPFRVWVGYRLVFGVFDPDQVQTVILSSKANQREEMYKFFQPWVGTSIFTASGTEWRHRRKLIAPTFNQQILDTFVTVFSKQSQIMITNMRNELNKDEFEIFNYVSLATLDMICETAMGIDLQAQRGHNTRYVSSVHRMLEIVSLRMYKLWLQHDFIFNWTKHGKDQRKCLDYLNGITDEVIRKKRIAYRNNGQVENKVSTHERNVTKKPFLDLLMELSNTGAELTNENLRNEVGTMIPAGNDTSAVVESFVMVMFATFPEIQDKAYKELCDIFGNDISSDVPVTNEHLNRMEYMERVIKETMRLFPVAPIFARELTGDIKIGDVTLPKGSSVAIATLKLHRWDKYWPDPMKFDPDRFLPEEVAKRHPYCYIPFSVGPRNCLGQKYAMMSMKVLLSTVLRHYILKKDKFVDPKDIKLKVDFIMKPVEPLTLRIVDRLTDPKINNE